MSVGRGIPVRDGAVAPLVQLCVDVIDLPTAVAVAEMGVRAGVDVIELGTPLVSWVGINALGAFVERFPDHPTFLDAKVMDGSQPYVHFAGEMGIEMVSVCAQASNATLRTAVALAATNGVKVVADLYAVTDPVARGREVAELGVDALYLHYGWDELAEAPGADPSLPQLAELRALTDKTIGVVTSDTAMGEAAAAAGADVLLVSHPYLMGDEAEGLLTDYVARVKRAAAATAPR